MEQFELTVFRQSRILIAIVAFGLSLPGAAYLATMIDETYLKIILPLLTFIAINLCSFYSVYGELTVMAKEDKLCFIWTEKFIFNFSPIADVHLKDIQKIILDKMKRTSQVGKNT